MSASMPPGLLNFRDVGGMLAGERIVHPGQLFRSDVPTGGDASRAALRAHGIETVVDLRDEQERAHIATGFDSHWMPLLPEPVGAYLARATPVRELYRVIIDERGQQLAGIVAALAASEAPALVHCTAGKDRTGTTIAMTLSAIGVDRDAVVADYASSEGNLPEAHTRAIMARLSAAAQPGVSPEDLEELIRRSPAAAITWMLDRAADAHGSAAGYLIDHGLDPRDLDRLRERLLD